VDIGPSKSAWARIRRGEADYARQLRKVAAAIGRIVEHASPVDPRQADDVAKLLTQYADLITPWAQAVAKNMLDPLLKREKAAWLAHSQMMSNELRRELLNAPTGQVYRRLMQEQVELIRSLPLEAAEKVHELTTGRLSSGSRDDLAEKIQALGSVTRSRAELIAVTETGRAAANLMQARAQYVGSTEYVWRTQRDRVVRPSHREMEGKTVRWDSPPTLDNLTGHAGCVPRCRCWSEPILPNH